MSTPTYTYTPDTPAGGTQFNDTQSPILNNFRAINEFANINHASFNTTDYGKHIYAQMPTLASIPDPIITDINVFAQATSSPNPAELFMQYPTGTILQLSGGSSSESTTTPTYGTGWIQFPSGIIIKYGTYEFTTNAAYFYFPTGSGIPVFKTTVAYGKITSISNPSQSVSPNNSWAFNPCPSFSTTYIFGGSYTEVKVNYFCIGI